VLSGAWTQAAEQAPLMSKEELRTLLDRPEVIVLDVRQASDWTSSEYKIPGAVHADPRDYKKWIDYYPKDKQLVLYCA